MQGYEQLLDHAYQHLPETVKKSERFEIVKVRGHIQGNRTVISNFIQIADHLGRAPEFLLKFILKELASPGEIKGQFVFVGSKVPASRINEKIEQFTQQYVICKECGKPDTKLIKEGSYLFMRCTACGAKHTVTAKK